MTATIKQPSIAPTNKLTAAIIGGVIFEFAEPAIARLVEILGEQVGIAWSLGPNASTALMFLTMFLAGYMIKDRPNVP